MLNNEVRLIGVAISNYNIENKVASFTIEMEKQQKGTTYNLEIKAYSNSKTIKFEEKIKGKLVALTGFIDDQKNIVATNVLVLTGKGSSPENANKDVEVVTAKDFESTPNIEIADDDLPF